MAHAYRDLSPHYLGDQAIPLHLPPLARRAARVAIVSLMAATAVMTGLRVGRLGQGTRQVPSIAPTRQPVGQSASAPREAPWPVPGIAPAAR